MHLHGVSLETSEIHAGVSAFGAMVRLLPRVRPDVSFQVGRGAAGVAALGALVRLATGVHQVDVLFEAGRIFAGVAAIWTMVRFLVRMFPHVPFEVLRGHTGVAALRTADRLFVGVHLEEVLFENGLIPADITAQRASDWLLAGVGPHVLLESGRRVKARIAHCTLVSF